jgi:hypothetical protein
MTSIEWLIDQINKHWDNKNVNSDELINQAKLLHKQEIADAWEMGRFNIDDFGLGEEYYQETFKKD